MNENFKCGTFKDLSEFPADVRAQMEKDRAEALREWEDEDNAERRAPAHVSARHGEDTSRPQGVGELRESVAWFASIMERELRANDHKPGWKNDRAVDLLDRVFDEAHELNAAIAAGGRSERIIKEAADVANFAMMIADNASAGKDAE